MKNSTLMALPVRWAIAIATQRMLPLRMLLEIGQLSRIDLIVSLEARDCFQRRRVIPSNVFVKFGKGQSRTDCHCLADLTNRRKSLCGKEGEKYFRIQLKRRLKRCRNRNVKYVRRREEKIEMKEFAVA